MPSPHSAREPIQPTETRPLKRNADGARRQPNSAPSRRPRAALSALSAFAASLLALGGCAAVLGIDEVDHALDDGASGAAGLGAGGGTSGGPVVGGEGGGRCGKDRFEPNDGIKEAAPLEKVRACAPASRLEGASGPGDVDWFATFGTTSVACLKAEPRAKLTASAPSAVCYYVKASENAAVGCSIGTASDDVPGFKGCCGEGEVALVYDGAVADVADVGVLLRVAPLAAEGACFAYALEYSF